MPSPPPPCPCPPLLHLGARSSQGRVSVLRSCPRSRGLGARCAAVALSPMTPPAPTCLFQGGEVLDTLQVSGQQDTEHRNLQGRETVIPGGVPLLQRTGTGVRGRPPASPRVSQQVRLPLRLVKQTEETAFGRARRGRLFK